MTTKQNPSDDPMAVQEMNALIEDAEQKAVTAQISHQTLIAAFKQYLAGKALGKEYAAGLQDPGAVHQG